MTNIEFASRTGNLQHDLRDRAAWSNGKYYLDGGLLERRHAHVRAARELRLGSDATKA